jgi:hypothetical protein
MNKVKVIWGSVKFILLPLFLFASISFSQNFKFFQIFSDKAVVQYDLQGNPNILTYSYSTYDTAFYFYLIRYENGNFKTPVYVGKAYSSMNYLANLDFDFDASGVAHIAAVVWDSDPNHATKASFFYLNSQTKEAVFLYEFNISSYFLNSSAQVIRTLDNKIVVNFLVWATWSFKPIGNLVWCQLFNPPSNMSATIDTVPASGNVFLTNKNLFILNQDWRITYFGSSPQEDSVLVYSSLKKVYPGGRVETVWNNESVHKRDQVPNNIFRMLVPDYNDGVISWFLYTIESQVPQLKALKLDRAGNLHMVDMNNVYSVYSREHLPISTPGTTPTYQYPVVNDSMTHYYMLKSYNPDRVYLSAFDLNKALMILRNPSNSVGSSFLYQENGNFRYEFLPLFVNMIPSSLLKQGHWVDRDNKVYIFSHSNDMEIDSSQGSAYIYLYPLKNLGDDYVMNYNFSEIKKVQISPIPFGRLNKVYFTGANNPPLDKDNRMNFLIFVTDSILPPPYGIDLGRLYLLKETSTGGWETYLISSDTIDVVNADHTAFTIDLNGVVHVVYSYKSKIFYTNNEGGSFKPAIIVDSTYINQNITVKAVNSALVYIYGWNPSGNDYYYYGNYASGFRKSSRFYNGVQYLEIDNNSNLYLIQGPVIYSDGQGFQIVKLYRDSLLIFGRTFFKYTRNSPEDPGLFFSRGKDGLLHLLLSFNGKIYYWNSGDAFTARTEYDYSNLVESTRGLTCSINGFVNERERKIYLLMSSSLGAQILGWIPYIATSIEASEELLPSDFALHQNYPNPFNPTTMISFELPLKSSVEISIYDVLGRKVKSLVDDIRDAGKYRIQVDMSGYASGVYFYRIIAKPISGGNEFISVRKMLLVK